MDSISNLGGQFYNWLNNLDGAMAALVGGAILAIVTGFLKFVLLPVGKKFLAVIGELLYPIASGAILLGRHIALPRYPRNLSSG